MTRIVSGFQTQGGDWDGGAVLRGFKSGQNARLDEERNQRANAGLAFQIQQALADQLAEETAAQQKQAAAQQQSVEMGKAGKLQQMAQRAQAGQVNPGQKFVERVIGARGRLQDPKALAMFDASVEDLLKSQKAAKSRKAFDDSFARAQKDTKVFKPEQLQSIQERRSAGEDDETLAQELSKMRMESSAANVSRAENEKVLAEALATVQAQPDGFGKRAAMIALDAVMSSDSAMGEEGSGAKAAQAAAEALLGPRSEYGKGADPFSDPDEREAAIKALEEAEVEVTEQAIRARIGRKYGQRPKPTPQEEQIGKTRREAAGKPYFLERRGAGVGKVVTEAVRGGARGADIVKLIRDQGLDPNDPAVMAEIEAAISGGG